MVRGRVIAATFLVTVLAACSSGSKSAGEHTTSTSAAATTVAPTAFPAPTTSTVLPIRLRKVNWSDITVPGAVCHLPSPVVLHGGQATVAAPATLHAGTPDVIIGAALPPTFGDLLGTDGDDVAGLLVSCSNTGGTADGQIAFTWLVFQATPYGPKVIGTLTPREPFSVLAGHVPYFDYQAGISIRSGSVTVKELWYGPSDSTCCPSGRATTTWTYSAGGFSPSTVVTRDTAPIPTFSDASSWPIFTGHSAEGGLVGLNPQSNQAKVVIDCGPGVDPGVVIVNLSGLSFEEDTDPRNPAAGSVRTVSRSQWESDVAHDGWSGYMYLNATPPRISDAPGPFGCNDGKITGLPTG